MLLLFAQAVLGTAAGRGVPGIRPDDTLTLRASAPVAASPLRSDAATPSDTEEAARPDSEEAARPDNPRLRRAQERAARRQARRNAAAADTPAVPRDTLAADTLAADTMQRDTARKPRKATGFLDGAIEGKSTDSLVYDVRNKLVYVYNEGDVTYQNSNLKADFMRIDMTDKTVFAYGKPDSLDGKAIVTKPEFSDGSASYQMDTITSTSPPRRPRSRAWRRRRATDGSSAAA